jgi:23S rRNA pseudouridine1911/1915/1917 synthase
MKKSLQVNRKEAGMRLDMFLAYHFPNFSRSRLEKLARSGGVLVDGRLLKPSHHVSAGETVVVEPPAPPPARPQPEPTRLDLRGEDEVLLVVNKPPGLTVHPGAGRSSGTLVNALLAHCRQLSDLGGELRPGIVHRLDKDTSGLLVVAKTNAAHLALQAQVRRREMERRYLALVWGEPEAASFSISVPLARHRTQRTRMTAAAEGMLRPGARSAATGVVVKERYGPISLLEAKLLTGRTHQIRVHLAHAGHPVVGDPTYGRRQARARLAALSPELRQLVRDLPGQALHAYHLSFAHPLSGERQTFEAEMPEAMARLTAHLRRRQG